MKKFLVPLLFVLLFSCSSDGFKSDIAADTQKRYCKIDDNNVEIISKNLCDKLGGIAGSPNDNVSSSSDEEISSSSGDYVSSSSRNTVSSSSRNTVSSSSGGADSSSSSGGGGSSSSSGDAGSSSSSGGAVSSSSGSTGSSSSSGDEVSSSSTDSPSSSSEPLPEPAWIDCNIPQYVGRNEPIANLKFISIENNNGRCGTITYRLNGAGQNVTTLNYSSSAVGTTQTLNITAYTTCSGGITLSPKSCSKAVTVANYVKFSATNDDTSLQSGKTVVDVGGMTATKFGCQALSSSGSPNPFEGNTSFILDGITVVVTDNPWWVKTAISSNRMLFESNNTGVGSYRCQIEE